MHVNQLTREIIQRRRTAATVRNNVWNAHWKEFVCGAVVVLAAFSAKANGGPFVIKYPGGDPAAKGVLARLDPSLKPAREERLKVIKEELTIAFAGERFPVPSGQSNTPALANVQARYFIANPTDDPITVDFGFPILRGVYMNPWSMMPTPDVRVVVKAGGRETNAPVKIISNSAIYGLIRGQARERIEAALERHAALRPHVKAVRESTGEAKDQARQALAKEMRHRHKWNERDTALLVEYVGLDLGANLTARPFDAGWIYWLGGDESLRPLLTANLGPLAAIGEQKATQLLAHLAGRFDPQSAGDYESIFAAWGGEVRERSVDLGTGKVRPREFTAPADASPSAKFTASRDDPTIYARVDYLDENVKLSEDQKTACKMILKNLPVTFTFAPMNLLYYRVTFAAKAEQTVTVSYSQYAYRDTRAPESHQIAYVVHPASLWKEFGPIQLSVLAPEGVRAVASVPLRETGTASLKERFGQLYPFSPQTETTHVEALGDVTRKTGELFVAVDATDWRNHIARINEQRMKPKPKQVQSASK